jgi:hypothetical protein
VVEQKSLCAPTEHLAAQTTQYLARADCTTGKALAWLALVRRGDGTPVKFIRPFLQGPPFKTENSTHRSRRFAILPVAQVAAAELSTDIEQTMDKSAASLQHDTEQPPASRSMLKCIAAAGWRRAASEAGPGWRH